MNRVAILLVVLGALFCLAAAKNGKVIYGTDDRKDTYQVSDSLQNFGQGVAVFMSGSLQEVNGNLVPESSDVGTAENLLNYCPSERFSDQQVIDSAFCSGFLLSKDPPLLATAAHCVEDIASTSIVFRYEVFDSDDGTNLIFDDSDVYSISEVIVAGEPNGEETDYALVRLDRPVTGRNAYRDVTRNVDIGDDTILIGHPNGIPKKFESGGSVTALEKDGALIRATVDAYGGNSGSPVFNDDRELIGILVAGGTDFVTVGGCKTSNVCPGGEECEIGEYIAKICNLLDLPQVQSVLDFGCDGDNDDGDNDDGGNDVTIPGFDDSSSSAISSSIIVVLLLAFVLF